MLHLLYHVDGSGGKSLLVDGFRAAMQLKSEAPEAYETLSRVLVPSHASGNDGVSIQPVAPNPVLSHHPVTGELIQVRWNNDDRATMSRGNDFKDLEDWYDAARRWSNILVREESEHWEQLQPGRSISESYSLSLISFQLTPFPVFDNWRALHGRSAFTGSRRLCGGYSEFRLLWSSIARH